MLLTREDSFEILPMGDQQVIPAQKTPKLIFVLFFLFFLVVAAEGAYYLYLRSSGETPSLLTGIWKKKETGDTVQEVANETVGVNECGSSENPCPSPDPNTNRYFEGLNYYEEVDGEKRLLVIEGVVDEIDLESKTVTLVREGAKKTLQYNTGEKVSFLINSLDSKEILFEEIEKGNFVSYNPVDESINRYQVIWIVQEGQ